MKRFQFKHINLIAIIQTWMDSPKGLLFLNYAYNWGAAIVILGTLFKLTHMAGADIMLWLGMGTEVFVFFISGFDRPFWKENKEECSAVNLKREKILDLKEKEPQIEMEIKSDDLKGLMEICSLMTLSGSQLTKTLRQQRDLCDKVLKEQEENMEKVQRLLKCFNGMLNSIHNGKPVNA